MSILRSAVLFANDFRVERSNAVGVAGQSGPGVTRGENPVRFEIELRYDGTITVRYGDGNQKTLPVVGLGGGWPEPYVSTSDTSESNLKDLTNAATVVFARRNPVQRSVLTVASSNPANGVSITVSPNDVSGLGSGTTQFTRTYNPGTTVTLTHFLEMASRWRRLRAKSIGECKHERPSHGNGHLRLSIADANSDSRTRGCRATDCVRETGQFARRRRRHFPGKHGWHKRSESHGCGWR